MSLTLLLRYLLLGWPADTLPPAVLVARLLRIISMSCSSVDCFLSGNMESTASVSVVSTALRTVWDISSHGRFGARWSSTAAEASDLRSISEMQFRLYSSRRRTTSVARCAMSASSAGGGCTGTGKLG